MAQAGLDSYVNRILVGYRLCGYIRWESDSGMELCTYQCNAPLSQGILKGCDQTVNLILENSHERVYSSSSGVEKVPLGLYIIRGDNIAVVGEIDEEMEHEMRFSDIKAEPLNPVVH